MKTLGMIGGTSWYSTIEYYRYINQLVSAQRGKFISPPLLIKSINMEIMAEGNWGKIEQKFTDTALLLERAGVDALMFCANTPHKIFPQVEKKLAIPMIHIADAIAEAAKKQGISKLALLGTENVMGEDFLSGRMKEKYGLKVLVPSKGQQPLIHQVIVEELVQGIFKDEARSFILGQMNDLKAQGAEGIALACTEFPILMKDVDFELPMLNTTLLHAEKGVEFILS